MSHTNQIQWSNVKILIGVLSAASSTFAEASNVIKMVVNQNGSQITEQANSNQDLSFIPNIHSFIPVTQGNRLVSQVQRDSIWASHLDQTINITSKYRDLSFEGTLLAANSDTITVEYNDKVITLPADDFYLINNKNDAHDTLVRQHSVRLTTDGLVTYHTDEIRWQPSLTLVFDSHDVSIVQQALLTNNSHQPHTLSSALLKYKSHSLPLMEMKSSRMSALSDEGVSPSYEENQITYSLEGQYLLPALSNTMITLKNTTYPIESKLNIGSIYAHPNSSNERPISFNQTTSFTLKEESVSGTYKTLWLQNEHYIPGQAVTIQGARANQKVDVITHQSLDVIGSLRLISTSSRKLPSTQIWEFQVKNYAKIKQKMAFTHQANGVIQSISPAFLKRESSSAIIISKELAPNEKYIMQYEIRVTE
ncbi:hypothetical protein [Marinomonas balearica]|uniref:DUF4139 domain-containing protein n=1 Tax=Marinomonas balearica TaxID=491947 RepID=A0A4R6MDN0_9GAMM|nr:hypothetical protein [Marinomonas balearica]TDO99634.1 hypothetical protein DFP79_0621 [Marinomonas balearica]